MFGFTLTSQSEDTWCCSNKGATESSNCNIYVLQNF